ncbi:MAG: hypothetical protein A2033_00055 [Bacteroidetes bacterium GWA2_31_9]|nr:MAG: hypothetical protein A2033_00055 [Bacteroidetes bacterium GWA2_31_9]
MDLQTKKINLIHEFLRINNEGLINKLDKFLHIEKKKIYEKDLKPMTIEKFNLMIDQAEDDIDNGRVVEAKNLRKDIDKWK